MKQLIVPDTPEESVTLAGKPRTGLYILFSVVLAVISSLVHIADSTEAALPLTLATIGTVLMFVNLLFWNQVKAFRRFVRGVYIGVPGVAFLFGILMAIVFYKDNRDATFGYLMAAYGTLVLAFMQTFLAFMLPSIAATSHFNRPFDLIFFPSAALLNALIITYFALFAIPEGYLVAEYDTPSIMNGYALIAWVYAAAAIIPQLQVLARQKGAKRLKKD